MQKMGASIGLTHPMSATGGTGIAQNPMRASSTPPGGAAISPARGSNPQGAATTTGSLGNNSARRSLTLSHPAPAAPSSVGPTHSSVMTRAVAAPAPAAIPPPPSSSATSKLGAMASAPLQNVCPPGPGPGVLNINGKLHGVIFTPDPNGNEYTIVGCRFGNSKGDLHLEGGFRAGTIPLLVESWSDTLIKARMNPGLSGELDRNNVSLVIVPVGSPSLTRIPGFSFYAMRETVALKTFPKSGVALGSITDADGNPVPGNFTSPFSASVNNQPTGTFTAGVYRTNLTRFSPGTDSWDLNGLAQGFVPVQFQIGYWTWDGCNVGILPAEETIYNDGRWNAYWDPQNGNRIVVNFAELHCHRSASLMQIPDDYSDSEYALTIFVVGPKGVDPWSK
jgi:hypothetical protein